MLINSYNKRPLLIIEFSTTFNNAKFSFSRIFNKDLQAQEPHWFHALATATVDAEGRKKREEEIRIPDIHCYHPIPRIRYKVRPSIHPIYPGMRVCALSSINPMEHTRSADSIGPDKRPREDSTNHL